MDDVEITMVYGVLYVCNIDGKGEPFSRENIDSESNANQPLVQ